MRHVCTRAGRRQRDDDVTEDQSNRDRLFETSRLPGDFTFDDNVAAVFDDMINRSVPGYRTILSMIAVMAAHYCQRGSRVYDLGSSLGGATLAIIGSVPHRDYEIVAVDNSEAMMRRLRERLESDAGALQAGEGVLDPQRVDCRCEDLNDTVIANASVVVLNFTLQFVPLAQRERLVQRIYQGMNPGGVLILSEKIRLPDPALDALMIDLHHDFKESMGYSRLEISQKRTALENVLIPETLQCHRERLASAGFGAIDVWFQCFNFASLVAFR